MSTSENPPGSLVTWRDFERHERAESEALRRLELRQEAQEQRIDRIESLIDQMKGVRSLLIVVFGGSVVTALVSVITLVTVLSGKP